MSENKEIAKKQMRLMLKYFILSVPNAGDALEVIAAEVIQEIDWEEFKSEFHLIH